MHQGDMLKLEVTEAPKSLIISGREALQMPLNILALTADAQGDLRDGSQPTARAPQRGIRTYGNLPDNPGAARTQCKGHSCVLWHMHTTMVTPIVKDQHVQPGTSGAIIHSPRDTAIAPADNGFTCNMVVQEKQSVRSKLACENQPKWQGGGITAAFELL